MIDGLDESGADDKNEIVNLIAHHFPDLLEYIKFLVKSRPGHSVKKLRGVQKINIANDDAKNNGDIELYFKICFPSFADRIIHCSSKDGDLFPLAPSGDSRLWPVGHS